MYAVYKEGVLQENYLDCTFLRNFELGCVPQSIEYNDNSIILYYLYKGEEVYLEIYRPLKEFSLYSFFRKNVDRYKYGGSIFTVIYRNREIKFNDIDKLWEWYDKWKTNVVKRNGNRAEEITIEEHQNNELVNIIKQNKHGIRLRMYKASYDTLTYDFYVRMYKFIEGS